MNDEFESALFEPGVILPSQISVDAQWVSETSGPIALMLAVLEEAARCIERGRQRRHSGIRKLAAEAEAWVRCDSREWPFAFASICDVLGLDVDAARARFLGRRGVPNRRATYRVPNCVAPPPSGGPWSPRSTICPLWGAFSNDDIRLSGPSEAKERNNHGSSQAALGR